MTPPADVRAALEALRHRIGRARLHLEAAELALVATIADVDEAAAEAVAGRPVGTPAPAPEPGNAFAADPPCPHPEDERQDASSLRHPHRFRCRRCGQLVNE